MTTSRGQDDRQGEDALELHGGSKREVNEVVNGRAAMGRKRFPPPGGRIILGANPWRDSFQESTLIKGQAVI